jgi:Spy/CpxP family protein refolding chaperone
MQKKKVRLWKVLGIGAVALTGCGLMAAQAAKQFVPRVQVAMLADRVQKQLDLSDAQKVKVKAILQDAIPRGIAIHDNMKLDPEDKRAQLQKFEAATKARVFEVLNLAQREKAEHWRESMMGYGKQTLENIANELKLTDEQRAKIKPILARRFKEGQALRDDMTLTLAQKWARGMEMRKATRTELDDILTPDQSKQLDSITKEMRSEARHQFGSWRDKNPGS